MISFFQWRSRYQGTFKKFRDIYNAIIEDKENTNNNLLNNETRNSIRRENESVVNGKVATTLKKKNRSRHK